MCRHPLATFAILLAILTRAVQAEPAIDPNEGRKHLAWQDARQALGEIAFISGEIVNVGSAGRVTFLNFDTSRPPKFVVVIFGESLKNFAQPLDQMYDGKIVRVRGRVSLYRDHPEIAVSHPDQIEILDELPTTTTTSAEAEPVEPSLAVDGQLVVATYNILNLFDDQDDPYRGDEGTGQKSREELESLARSMTELNADVIALQEVENRFYLQRFVDVFLADLGYEHVVHFEGNDTRGIDVCLISRVPIGPVRSYRHLTFAGPNDTQRRFNRDVLAVTIELPGAEPLEIWVLHLKSNSGGRTWAEPVRLAEARQLRKLLDQQLAANPQARILVMGDFNDTWGSETLKTIIGEGSTALWSPVSELEGGLPDTYNEGEYRSMIDFILCSPAMATTYVKDSFRVLPGSTETTGSDHNPVAANFRLQ